MKKNSKNSMKKLFSLIAAILMLAMVFLTACDSKDNAGSNEVEIGADIDTKESLTAIMDKVRETVGENVFVPMTFDSPLSADNCVSMTGLTQQQFEQYVMDGYSVTAAIMTQAFEVTLIKCKDYASAAEVKKLIKDGFDSNKWICVFPEQSFVVESGRFVLLGAVYNDVAETLQNSFAEQFTTKVGDVNKFYDQGEAGAGDMDIGGGLLIE